MIIGIDHLALSTENLDQGLEMLKGWNYEPEFILRNVPNHEAKKPYLSKISPHHDISLCRKKNGIAIELTAHAVCGPLEGPYRVFMDEERAIQSITIETQDLKKSEAFWMGLGFKSCEREKTSSYLKFEGPFSQWNLSLKIIEDKNKKKIPSKIDLKGFSCLALLSTQVISDRKIFPLSSELFEMNINHRKLKLCLLEGPDGECVELIEIL